MSGVLLEPNIPFLVSKKYNIMAKKYLKDLYDTLGVDKDSSDDEIKKKYRKLSKIYHPDMKETGDESRFKEILNAYEILSDPDKKAKYENDNIPNNGRGGFSESMMDELFKNFGGYGRRHYQHQNIRPRGDDLRVEIFLSIHELITGVHKKINLQRKMNCRDCSGSGAKNKESIIKCDKCGGTGVFATVQNTPLGQLLTQHTCPRCSGQGTEIKEKCNSCHGQGLVLNNEDIEFDIPAGATNGVNIGINGFGNEAKGGGDNGNLIINMNEIEHPIFKREGIDIMSDIFISYHDAVLGNDFTEINTVDGLAKIKIEPGTESGKVLRLKGKGIPIINNPSQRGDQLVYVNIFIPKTITEEEKKTIIELKNVKSAEPDNEKTQHIKGVYSRIREYDDLH